MLIWRYLAAVALLLVVGVAAGVDDVPTDTEQNILPKPRYIAVESDPPWLRYAAQFHGHLGPWATAGLRLGAAGREAVAARGYFDVQVRCQGPFDRPPKSCFLDGLQVATGATLGKRNLDWEGGKAVLVRVKNIQDEKTVTVTPTEELLQMLSSIRTRLQNENDHNHATGHNDSQKMLESVARRIAIMPTTKLCTIRVDSIEPE